MAKVTAISSLGWAHYTLYEALPRMAARGFKKIEIASFSTYCFHFNYGSPTPRKLKIMLKKLSLQPVCLNYSAGTYQAWVPEQMEQFVDDWTRKIQQTSEVGIPMMTMGFGIRNNRDDQESQRANAVRVYDRVGKIAVRYGVRMLLEVPHLYGIMSRVEDAIWVFDRLNSPNVGTLVDSSHWGIIGYDIDAFFSKLDERLWHIHLRDSKGTDTADFKQKLELTPGKGTVDFQKFAQALDRANYKGDVSLEFEYRDMTLDEIEQEFDLGLKHLTDTGWLLPAEVKIDSQEKL